MKRGALSVVAILAGAGFLARTGAGEPGSSACRQDSRAESVYSEIRKAPEKARAKPNPLEKDPDAVAAGRTLFEQRCRECHGDNATGGKKGPSLRAPEIQNAEPGAVFWILTNGVVRKGMPVWSKLPELERWQIVRYLKSLGARPAEAKPSSPDSPQPPAARDCSWRHR